MTSPLMRLRSLAGLLRARLGRSLGPRGPAPREFVAAIESRREALAEFGHVSDEEFTHLARSLGTLQSRLLGLGKRTDALAALLEDRDEHRALASAYALYKDSIDLVHANAGIAVSAQEQLAEVERSLVAACDRRAIFERDHLLLRIVTFSIRMEASRLPSESQNVFLNVAAAIAETGERIYQCTDTAFARLDAVITESRAARAELHANEESLHHRAQRSIATLQAELTALETALKPCAERCGAVRRDLAAIQPQVRTIISALQHQDIVRQQLEHVSSGFQDLAEHLDGDHGAEWDYVHQAVAIQSAQLQASRREIETAGHAVVGGVEGLLKTGEHLIVQFRELESGAGTALSRCRIVELFGEEIKQLADLVEESERTNARTGALVGRIEEVVGLFSREITRYELDVKIVALNAQIAAARLSSADALNRLAAETSAVSDANAGVSGELSRELQASLVRLEQVKKQSSEFLTIVAQEKDGLTRGLATVTSKLSQLIASVRTESAAAHGEFAPIQRDCDELLASLRFPSLADETFAPADACCAELLEFSRQRMSGTGPSATAAEKIQQHRDRYTMAKEVATHQAAVASASIPAAVPVAKAPALIRPTLPTTSADLPAPVAEAVPVLAETATPATPAASDSSFGDGIELF